MLVFTTWNTQTRRSTIQTYDLLESPRESEPPTPTTSERKSFHFDENEEPNGKISSTELTTANLEQNVSFESMARDSPSFKTDRLSITSCRERMTLMFEGDSRDGVTSLVITMGESTPKICSGESLESVFNFYLSTVQHLVFLAVLCLLSLVF